MSTPPRDRRPIRIVIAALALLAVALVVVVLARACTATPAAWKTDDLMRDQATGRYYVTCEDPYDDNHEREVWLNDASTYAEGADCPAGEIRRAAYYETDEEDRKAKANRVTRPAPTSRSAPAATPAAPRPTAAATTTTATTTTVPASKPAPTTTTRSRSGTTTSASARPTTRR